MQQTTSIVLKSLSILLGLFFLFTGFMKISPYISKELHRDLRKHYVKYAKAFPMASLFDIRVPSKWYRRIIGAIEVICGGLMAGFPSHTVKNAANATLLCLMFLALYSQYMANDPFERLGPTLVFIFMLVGRLVIFFQIHRKEKQKEDAAAAQANGIKQD
ncbi:hypothetical protein ACKWTF_002575 [Chironomus riparius]